MNGMTGIDTKGWLEGAMRDAGEIPEASTGGVLTVRVLAELGRAWPGPLTRDQHAALEALCRKIHVVGQVTARYGPAWKNQAGAGELDGLQWRLLVVVLIAFAAAQKTGTEEGRGLALKLINAAFAALDLAKGKLDAAVEAALGDGAGAVMALVLEGSAA